MQNNLEINVGPLSSFNSLTLYVGPQLDKLREDYQQGKQTIPIWDLNNISRIDAVRGGVSLAALVAFLSISKRIRDFIGQPISVKSSWNPELQGFLADIGFMQIAQTFDLYDWQGMVGGYTTGRTNPKTKIFYYSDLPPEFESQEDLNFWKDAKRQQIKHSMLLRLNKVFDSINLDRRWSENLEGVLTITGAELIVNALLHGKDVAFVGVQRSSTRITTTICDAGRGFQRSLKDTHQIGHDKAMGHAQALLVASLLSKNKIGLFRAIDDVIKTDGHVILSSYDSEIRWERKLWETAKLKFEGLIPSKIVIDQLGKPLDGYTSPEVVRKGYYKTYKSILIGSRITFEILL